MPWSRPWSRRFARGEEDALAELYDRVGRIAYGLAVRVVRDDRLAEDAVQEGFFVVWRSAASFRAERAKASTWILTLVHRRASRRAARSARARLLRRLLPVRARQATEFHWGRSRAECSRGWRDCASSSTSPRRKGHRNRSSATESER
ncbi:MAG: hypothetical protein H0U30_01330 [Actinobacteria bacterium]|nr:hypothetical protein [Actinomycetota bacterium]